MKDAGLLVRELAKTTTELEWVEFKTNNKDPKMIGRDISALANSATHREASCAYMIWGVDDVTHEVVGTEFDHRTLKCGDYFTAFATPFQTSLLQCSTVG